MTEEEINKKAEKHCNEVLCNAHENCNEVIKCRDWRSRRAGFFCGYEQALKDFEKENAELKEKVSFLEDNLRVARKDREDLQLDVAKGLKEFVKDYPATALRYLADEKYVEQLIKAKDHIKKLLDCLKQDTNDPHTNYYVCQYMDKAEQFLKDSEVEK